LKETCKFTCIVCPIGCQLELAFEDGEVKNITGYSCKRGKEYAQNEFIHPVRTLTSTVRIDDGEIPLLPVKTREPVDKHLIMDIMAEVNKIKVKAPISMNQVIIPDVLGTGVDVIATRKVNIKLKTERT
jgi:CxxC motif-containing protein